MQVFVVIGGIEFEGFEPETLKVFASREEAQEWAEELLKVEYDYYHIVEQKL